MRSDSSVESSAPSLKQVLRADSNLVHGFSCNSLIRYPLFHSPGLFPGTIVHTVMNLSPKLEERRRKRETRPRPWRDTQLLLPLPLGSRLTFPNTPAAQRSLARRSELTRRTLKRLSTGAEYQRHGPFNFLRLPYEIQVLIGEYMVYDTQPLKCEEFIPYNDGKLDDDPKAVPRRALSPQGYPIWIPLIQVCPWLARDLSRAWYRQNTFFVKSVLDWNAFVGRATWSNAKRIPHLHVDNEFIYCPGPIVGEDAEWRSHVVLSPMENLKTLTLYRDDGGPGTYTQGGHDDFNSVDWFARFATDCSSLQRIEFALYPWTGFEPYQLAKSNMVAWISDWEQEWDAVMAKRRVTKDKIPPSWYLTNNPVTTETAL